MVTDSLQEQTYLLTIDEVPELSAVAVDVAVTQLLLRSEVRKELAAVETNIQDVWQNDQGSLIEVCARHVLVATESEADDVLIRLEAGEDFAFVADEISIDTVSPGGVLPCPVSPATFIASFAAVVATAPVGELSGPVETGFGWHIIFIDSRESPASLDQLAADPVRWMSDDTLDNFWNSWLNDVVERADVTVRSDIGTWYPPVDGILPPPPSP